ncbi:MAG: YdeI/OmpD-associated family protein [Rickettsiales bacterium]|nr:YdeI/OmpD-associated family protein [Rickettsiales bacterium]
MIQETIQFKSRREWREWLLSNCRKSAGVWLIFPRRPTKVGHPRGLIYQQARDEALCFGWIDSTVRVIDDKRLRQYFSPRRPDSLWSRFNRNKIAELIEQNLMTAYGQEVIERAKSKGYYFLLDSVEDLLIPGELEEGFLANEKARDIFNGLSIGRKKRILYRIITLKTPTARRRNVDLLLENLMSGEKFL